MVNRPELLAPAGSREALRAGIASGADAVYLGGVRFSARASAANFDDRGIEEAVSLAHRHGVRVYVTVNTLLANSELAQVASYLYFLYSAGVDAVILQDPGLFGLARQVVPGLALHASTQMTIHNIAGARWLAGLGIRRVVLAREMQLPDIAALRQETGLEPEVFVHGALCVCYSGQCLMSSMIGGRSGNRGRCAQPCRLPYALVDRDSGVELTAGGQHLLSTRDLCLVERLPELVGAGIRAFKFEGRMRRPEYVATVVRVYRRALDRYLEDPEHFQVSTEETRDLYQVFNRDFTTGYLCGNPGRDLMSYQRPNNRGLPLGRLVEVDAGRRWGSIRLDEVLRVGDGIEVWVTRGGRRGVTVQQMVVDGEQVTEGPPGVTAEINLPVGVRSGDRVFKTYDQRLMALAQAATLPDKDARVPVRAQVWAATGEPLRIVLTDPDGYRGEARTEVPAAPALKRPLTVEILQEHLGRLGDTPFSLAAVEVDIDGELMVPLSEINAARRAAVEDLLACRAQAAGRPPISAAQFTARVHVALAPLITLPEPGGPGRMPRLSVVVGDAASAKAAVEAGADRLYLDPHLRGKPFNVREMEQVINLCREQGRQAVPVTPRIWHEEQFETVTRTLEQAAHLGASGVLVANPGSLWLARSIVPGTPLFGDYPLNAFNDLAVDLFCREGLAGLALSPELTMRQIAELASRRRYALECLVHGALPLMVTAHCSPGAALGGRTSESACNRICGQKHFGLLDRKQFVFPVEMDSYCRMYIYNPKELCLVEHLPEFVSLGIGSVRIEAGKEKAGYVSGVVRIYREALDRVGAGRAAGESLEVDRESLARFSPGGFTKGHYFRGVL